MFRNLVTVGAVVVSLALPAWSLLPGGETESIILDARPNDARQALIAGRSSAVDTVRTYETPHFLIVYSITGPHQLVLSDGNISQDARPNIEVIAEFAEKSWSLAIDTLGYKAPPTNATTTWYYKRPIPKGKLPIEIVDLGTVSRAFQGQPYMGYSISPTAENGGLAQILLENDFLYDSAGVKKPIRVFMNPRVPGGDSLLADYSNTSWMWDGWYTAISHEFYHCLQMNYEYSNLYAFHEMTASWFAMRATKSFPAVHHWSLNQKFLNSSNWGMFSDANANANALMIRALAKYAGDDMVRKLWEYRANSTSQALAAERVWFRSAITSLGVDLYGFLDYFASEIGCMYVNAVCDLNDMGLYRSVLPPIRYTNATIRDSLAPVEALAPNGWGTDIRGIGTQTISSGYRFRIEKARDTVPHSGFVLHLPSMTITTFSLRNGPVVVEKRSDDTLMAFFGFSGGVAGSGLDIYATKASVTPSGVGRKNVEAGSFNTRFDVLGRVLTKWSRGQYLGILNNGRNRPTMDLGR